MRERIFTGGNTVDERLESTERSLRRINRKTRGGVLVQNSQIVLYKYIVELNGEVTAIRMLTPVQGKLRRLTVFVDSYSGGKESLSIGVVISNRGEKVFREVDISDLEARSVQEILVSEGARLEIVIRGNATGVWISGIYEFANTGRVASEESLSSGDTDEGI